MSTQFWSDEESWPFDPAGWVFLARAYVQIGQAKFEDSWTGNEPFAKYYEKLKSTTDNADFMFPNGGEEWREYVDLFKKRHLADEDATKRHFEMGRTIAQLCEAGNLLTGYRMKEGGSIKELPANFWNVPSERIFKRFICCEITLHQGRITDDNLAFLFVSKNSLENTLATIKEPVAPSLGDGVHMTQFMKLMTRVSKDLKITAENQPKVEVVKSKIRERWKDYCSGDPTNRKVNPMATFIRDEESQAGKAKK